MKMDDIVLMAYVDGVLPQQDCRRVECEIAASPDVAERVTLFKASCMPYREAFVHQKLPPPPERLTNTIEELARMHAIHSRQRLAPLWPAAAFVGGVFCCGAVLRFAPGLNPRPATVASAAPDASSWVRAAASYQSLYARETIEQIPTDAAEPAQTIAEIRREDGLVLRVPDLREAGLTFKRVQRLRFNGRALIQIIYLPEKGSPVALCVIRDEKPDQAVTAQRIENMNIVTWRQATLGYALIGNDSAINLRALGKRITSTWRTG
jgi:anti-sigma factor RsiW